MTKSKNILYIAVIILITIGFLINWAFFDTQRIEGEMLLQTVDSPNNMYSVSVYKNNDGATVDYAILCTLRNNETGKEKNIYWNYHCEDATVLWIDNKTVRINGICLNVEKDVYDFRKNEKAVAK